MVNDAIKTLLTAIQAALAAIPERQDSMHRRAVGESCLMACDEIQQLEAQEPVGEGPEKVNRGMTGKVMSIV